MDINVIGIIISILFIINRIGLIISVTGVFWFFLIIIAYLIIGIRGFPGIFDVS